MGQSQSATVNTNSLSQQQEEPQLSPEEFKAKVRASADQFKHLVQSNKIMIFSATYCSYCTVAKRTLEELGTKYGSYEVNKNGEEGDMLMNVVSAVSGHRMVPAIFICGKLVPGGGSGLKQLATTGQLPDIIKECCNGDITCSKYNV